MLMKKWIIPTMIGISYLLVIVGILIDIFTSISMSGAGKVIFYGLPIVILFFTMLYEIKTEENEEKKEKIRKRRLWSIFLIYILALITLLFMPSSFRFYDTWQYRAPLFSEENLQNNINLIPFRTIGNYFERWENNSINNNIVITNLLGNLIAFAPFGFFVQLLMKDKIKNIGNFLISIVGIILVVEVLQFSLQLGAADIDDLILNTLGATIVYVAMQLPFIKRSFNKILN